MDYSILLEKAREVSEKAYAPYSKFLVGACVLADSGNIYVGCNVENASYGLTVCAERNAIAAAIANGEKTIKSIAIYSPNMKKCYPCGACRQVILEFGSEIDVITDSEDGVCVSKISSLLPEGFTL